MNNIEKRELVKKIIIFLRQSKSLKYIDSTIFENIDRYKSFNNINFIDNNLSYIKTLPKLGQDDVFRMSREVYQLYGKEEDFDRILESLIHRHYIEKGSLEEKDENCITHATESRILLSGTYYDVILLCHEIGHCLTYDNKNSDIIMSSLLFETPSIILELAANDYIKENYNIDLKADEVRKKHILSTFNENNINNSIFEIIIRLSKEKKLNTLNLYREFMKKEDICKHLKDPYNSIETSFDEGMEKYTYDIGYILSMNNDKLKVLNEMLDYIKYGIKEPFTITEAVIKEALKNNDMGVAFSSSKDAKSEKVR